MVLMDGVNTPHNSKGGLAKKKTNDDDEAGDRREKTLTAL